LLLTGFRTCAGILSLPCFSVLSLAAAPSFADSSRISGDRLTVYIFVAAANYNYYNIPASMTEQERTRILLLSDAGSRIRVRSGKVHGAEPRIRQNKKEGINDGINK
jgi:hypothetical protein